ncbi:MAG: LptF/LptG family permease, partial [Bacteroidota bacterium]
KKFTIARVHLNKYLESWGRYNIFIQDGPTRVVSLGFFDDKMNTAHRVAIQDYSPEDRTRMVARYDVKEMRWNSTSSVWVLVDGTMRTFERISSTPVVVDSSRLETSNKSARLVHPTSPVAGSFGVLPPAGVDDSNHGGGIALEQLTRFDSLMFVGLHFIPSEIKKKQERPDEMSYYDLRSFIENQKRAGQQVARWQVDFYSKISFPFASFIVVLFGVPFSSLKRRSGLAVEFGLSLGICFSYLAFMKISHTFGYHGDLDPLTTAWFANIIFFIAGMVNLWRVRK